jgi:microcystin-dependent protein
MDPFVAEIRIFGFNFAPRGWAFCNGQILPISQNTALFSLLGTTYGGDGKSTFGLPNMQGNVPLNFGQSSTGTLYDLGQMAGEQYVTLLQTEVPPHNHGVQSVPGNFTGNSNVVGGNSYAKSAQGNAYLPPASLVNMAIQEVSIVGNNQPHNNMMPYITLNFCIALQGVYPPRP